MAGLWSGYLIPLCRSGTIVGRLVLPLTLIALPACSELAQSREDVQPGQQPPYVSIAAKYLQSVLKDRAAYDGFEISGLRWVHSIKGWDWLACVRFQDHGHRRSYALFIDTSTVVDGRYAVATDGCDAQVYTEFDLVTGQPGRPTAPVQEPLY